MILEINDGKTTILCSKVVMNTKDRIEIKPATNGEVVTQAKYDEIALKKMQEMQEMNQGRGGSMQTIRINR
jgi:GLPGLI family protein